MDASDQPLRSRNEQCLLLVMLLYVIVGTCYCIFDQINRALVKDTFQNMKHFSKNVHQKFKPFLRELQINLHIYNRHHQCCFLPTFISLTVIKVTIENSIFTLQQFTADGDFRA